MATNRRYYFLRLILLIAMILYSGWAAAGDWKVVQMSGDVRVFHDNVTWVSLRSDYQLKPGDSVWTGRTGRVMLSSGNGRVILSPRSLVKIPSQRLPRNYSVLFHARGTIDAEVQKRGTNHFTIKTPYLAAVVKGTKFTITIGDGETELKVQQGVVGATNSQTGQSLNVRAGQYVATTHGSKGGMHGTAKGAKSAGQNGQTGGVSGTHGNGIPGGNGNGSSANDDSADYTATADKGRGWGRGGRWGNGNGWGRGGRWGGNRGRGRP